MNMAWRAWRVLVVGVVTAAIASCGSDADTSPGNPPHVQASSGQGTATNHLSELAAAASEQADALPSLLTIVNETSHEVVLTSDDGQGTISIEAGQSVSLGSERVCGWMPFTATAADGRVIAAYNQPCDGQTWTITSDPTSATDPQGSVPGNAAVTDRARAALTEVGARHLVLKSGYDHEVNTGLEGVWRGHPLVAFVVPTSARPLDSELMVVARRHIKGQAVDVVQGEDSSIRMLRFVLGPDTWLLASLDGMTTSIALVRVLLS